MKAGAPLAAEQHARIHCGHLVYKKQLIHGCSELAGPGTATLPFPSRPGQVFLEGCTN